MPGGPALLPELPHELLRSPSSVRLCEIRVQLTSGPGFAAVGAGAAVTGVVLRSSLVLRTVLGDVLAGKPAPKAESDDLFPVCILLL